MTSPRRRLNMLLMSLVVLLPSVTAESPERIPFYGFLPTHKIRALSPLGDGHPNDIYYNTLPDPAPIPDGFEIRYPSYKFAFDVPQDPEEAAYIITEKGKPTVKDCHHHHGKHGGEHGHHHGDGHGRNAGVKHHGAAAPTAPSVHSTVLPSRHATVAPSIHPTDASIRSRTTLPMRVTGHPTTSPTVPTTAAAVKAPTTLPNGYFRPPSPPPHGPHGRVHFGRPQGGFRPLRPPFVHHRPSFHSPRPPFTSSHGKFVHRRPPQVPTLIPGHTATPPPSRFKNLKPNRGKFPAEQYRVFPGGYARSSTFTKLSG